MNNVGNLTGQSVITFKVIQNQGYEVERKLICTNLRKVKRAKTVGSPKEWKLQKHTQALFQKRTKGKFSQKEERKKSLRKGSRKGLTQARSTVFFTVRKGVDKAGETVSCLHYDTGIISFVNIFINQYAIICCKCFHTWIAMVKWSLILDDKVYSSTFKLST